MYIREHKCKEHWLNINSKQYEIKT